MLQVECDELLIPPSISGNFLVVKQSKAKQLTKLYKAKGVMIVILDTTALYKHSKGNVNTPREGASGIVAGFAQIHTKLL